MRERFKSGSNEWFLVHVTFFTCILLMILLSYPIFGVFTDEQISYVCVVWCGVMLLEGIVGLKGWVTDVSDTD